MMRRTLLVLLAMSAAAPLHAQGRDAPRRPRLQADADSNSAHAYFLLGQNLLERRPAEAADAFYWAAQIEPGWAEPLYGRHVALLMSDPRRLVRYADGDRRTIAHPEVVRIDSLYERALRMDPFLQRRFERELVRLWVRSVLGEMSGPGADQSLVAFYSDAVMRELPPMMRGRILAGDGRLPEALRAFDEALGETRRRYAVPAVTVRHERGRMFALAGNYPVALTELGAAVDAAVEEESGDELVRFYESKAVLEYSTGMVHERAGDPGAAREAYARALLEDLSYHPAHMRLGALALGAGDTAMAVQELGMAAQAGSADPIARLRYGTVLAAVQRLEEAEAELVAATELAPYFAEPWYLLGLVRDWRGVDSAPAYRAFLARARRDDPRRPRVEPLAGTP